MRGELTRETRTRMTECSLSSRSKEENGWNGCTESRRICARHIFRRGDIHVARDTAGAAAAANLHAGTMRPASGRHKWRPYVFPYTGRTTGLPRRGDIHVARDTARTAASGHALPLEHSHAMPAAPPGCREILSVATEIPVVYDRKNGRIRQVFPARRAARRCRQSKSST